MVRERYPDHTQFDKASEYYDARSSPDNVRWEMVDIQLERRLARCVRCVLMLVHARVSVRMHVSMHASH